MTRYLLLAASVAAISSPAFGQTQADAKDDEVVIVHASPIWAVDDIIVTGSQIGALRKTQQTAPASVVTLETIEARGADFTQDILRNVPGIAVSRSGGAGQLTQLRLRGSEANHVLVLIDGVEVANPADGAFDFGTLNAANIVRVEVLRGAQSAIYGSNAIGGVINVLTKSGGSRDTFSASLSTGSFGTLSGAFTGNAIIINNAERSASVTLSGNAFTSDGYDISPVGDEADAHMSRNISAGFLYNTPTGLSFEGKLGYGFQDTEFDSFPQFGSSDDSLTREQRTARLNAHFRVASFENELTASRHETQTDSYGSVATGVNSQLKWAAQRKFNAHTIIGLIEAEQQSYEISNAPETGTYDGIGAALDYRFDGDTYTLSASARHDSTELFSDQATWRLGAQYRVYDWNGAFRGSIGTGVKNPTLIELFGFTPGGTFINADAETVASFIGNSGLSPETSLDVNIGYVQNFEQGYVSVDVFASELDNEIYTVFGGFDFSTFARLSADTVANRNTLSKRHGVELEGRWKVLDTVSLSSAATWVESQEDGTAEQRRPEWTASLSADWDATDDLSLNATVNYTGDQIDTDFGSFQTVTLDAYTLLSANARYALSDNFTLSLRGENLLDEAYQEVFGYQSQTRSVHLGLSANF